MDRKGCGRTRPFLLVYSTTLSICRLHRVGWWTVKWTGKGVLWWQNDWRKPQISSSQESRPPGSDSNKHVPNTSLKGCLSWNLFSGSENGRHLWLYIGIWRGKPLYRIMASRRRCEPDTSQINIWSVITSVNLLVVCISVLRFPFPRTRNEKRSFYKPKVRGLTAQRD
jgi:hypothetical protein